VQFYIVYIREAHAIDSPSPNYQGPLLEDPIDIDERSKAATTCVADLNLPIPAIVDGLDDAVNRAYAGWPDRLYLIGTDGRLTYAGGRGPMGFAPDELEEAIRAELAKRAREYF
jgi:hypothetical protein